jgi:hypothetical protein
MNPTIAAAAWILLTGGPAPAPIPAPTIPQPPILDCQVPHAARHAHNHLTIRWVSAREYYDRRHHHPHHPRHGAPGAR